MRVLILGKDGIRRAYQTGGPFGLKVKDGWFRLNNGKYHIDPTMYFREAVPIHGTFGLWKVPRLSIEYDAGNPEPMNRLGRPAPTVSRTAEDIDRITQGAPLNSWLPRGTDWHTIIMLLVGGLVGLGLIDLISRMI